MTLADLRTSVRSRLGVPSTDNFFTTAVLTEIINEAVQAYSVEAEWPWLQVSEIITTNATDQSYAPNANWNYTRTLWITGFEPIDFQPIERIVESTGVGQPSQYTIAENKIKLAPQPDTAYAINHVYYRTEPLLVGDSDTTILPSQFQYAVVALAVAIAYQRRNQLDAYQVANAIWGQWLRRLQNYKKRSSGPVPPKTFRTY